MSSKESQILNALETEVGNTLGSNWTALNYVYEVEKNHFNNQRQAYGIGIGSGLSVEGTNKAITKDKEFFIILTKDFSNQGDDVDLRSAIKEIYDNKELIDKDLFQKKLGLPNIVLLVQNISDEEPTLIADNVVMIRSTYSIKYRNQTT